MPPEKSSVSYDFLRRHYPHQVQGSKVYLPLSLSHKLPCSFDIAIIAFSFLVCKRPIIKNLSFACALFVSADDKLL